MADDLEEFLRQAAQRRKQRQQPKPDRTQIEAPPPLATPIERQPFSTLSQSSMDAYESQPVKTTTSIPTAEIVEEPSRFQKQETSSLGTSPTNDRTSKKGKKNPKPQLTDSTSSPPHSQSSPNTATGTPSIAQLISQTMRDPRSIRSAIVISEILKRPWE